MSYLGMAISLCIAVNIKHGMHCQVNTWPTDLNSQHADLVISEVEVSSAQQT